MRNLTLFASILSVVFIISCTTQKKVITKTESKIINDTVYVEKLVTVKDNGPRKAELRKYRILLENYPSTMQNERVRFLVMHYTNANFERSMGLLDGSLGREVSSHYLVGDQQDKDIYLLVDESKRAWHAGVSFWRGRNNLNDTSIGIEIVNLGFEEEAGIQSFYDFPDHQIKKVGELARDIVKRYPDIDPTNVIGHSDIAPGRKYDPGPKFPWKKLYEEYGVGAWYDEEVKNEFLNQFNFELKDDFNFITQIQKDLAKYGYKIEVSGVWDQQTKNVIIAFQHHFRPQNYDGNLDGETWAILQALIQKYRS